MKNIIKNLMSEGLPLIAGGVGSGFVKNLAGKVTSNTKIQAAIPLLAGVFLSTQKNTMMKFAGYGMMASAGRDLAGQFIPQIAGIENMDLSGVFGNVINEQVINDSFRSQPINRDTVIFGDVDEDSNDAMYK